MGSKIDIFLRVVKYGLTVVFVPLAILIILESGKTETGLKRIASSNTCMGSNQAQEKAQNYAMVDGKSYYGCTDMCIANLKKHTGFRYGRDPVSGNRVDKALAIVGAKKNGQLLYFESERNLLAYRE